MTAPAITRCQTCGKLYRRTWPDQAHCPTCQPLGRLDPDRHKLADQITRNIQQALP